MFFRVEIRLAWSLSACEGVVLGSLGRSTLVVPAHVPVVRVRGSARSLEGLGAGCDVKLVSVGWWAGTTRLRMNPLKRLWAWLHGDTKLHPHQDGDQQLSYRQDDPNAATWPDATREASEPE